MDAYIVDWLSLIFRWLHVITGVAWIGALVLLCLARQ